MLSYHMYVCMYDNIHRSAQLHTSDTTTAVGTALLVVVVVGEGRLLADTCKFVFSDLYFAKKNVRRPVPTTDRHRRTYVCIYCRVTACGMWRTAVSMHLAVDAACSTY